MVALRPIDKNDYAVIDDGNTIGRIRHAAERTNDIWMWNVTIPIPGGVPYGNASDLEPAKVAFQEAWLKFKAAAGPEQLAQAIETLDKARTKGKASTLVKSDANSPLGKNLANAPSIRSSPHGRSSEVSEIRCRRPPAAKASSSLTPSFRHCNQASCERRSSELFGNNGTSARQVIGFPGLVKSSSEHQGKIILVSPLGHGDFYF